MEVNIENMCRTCLGISGLLSIYDKNTDGCIAIMLAGFTKIKATRGDNMPEKVCLNCISEINHCYTFMLKCENSNRTLRQLLPDAAPEEVETNKSTSPRPVMLSKSVQTNDEKKKDFISTHVQTVAEKQDMVDQQVQTEYEVQPKVSALPQKEDNKKTIVLNKEVKKSSSIKPLNDSNELDDDELMFKHFEDDEEQVENEIILQLLDKRVSTNDSKVQDAKQQRQKRKLAALNYSDSAALIEIDDSSIEYNTAAIDGGEGVHYKKRRLKAETILDQVLEEHITEEAVDEEFIMDSPSPPEPDLNFTIYEVRGEPKLVPRRSLTRACNSNKSAQPKFKCPECTMIFTSEKLCNRHMLKKHTCYQDGLTKSTTDDKDKSEVIPSMLDQSTTATDFIELNEKPNVFVMQNDAESEMVKLKYFCDRCNAGFALSKSLSYHRQLKSCDKESFQCEECERVFISMDHLKEHRYTHILANTCTECNNVFSTAEQLSQHMVDEHNRNLRNQCNVCKKVFTMTSALRDHLRTHSGEKPFVCPVCGKGFSQNANLKQHVMRHTKEKNFKCTQCSNSFVTKAELASHTRRHTGDAPFKCDYCDSTFTTSSSLLKHRRKHTGERPYACDICPMRFAALNVLKNHRRTHTGEKPFKCIYCNKAFTQKGDCHIHQRSHTEKTNPKQAPKKIYACPCGENFNDMGSWRAHKCDSKRNILNSTATSPTKMDAMHVTILDTEVSNDASTLASTNEVSQDQSGEELIQMAIEMC